MIIIYKNDSKLNCVVLWIIKTALREKGSQNITSISERVCLPCDPYSGGKLKRHEFSWELAVQGSISLPSTVNILKVYVILICFQNTFQVIEKINSAMLICNSAYCKSPFFEDCDKVRTFFYKR